MNLSKKILSGLILLLIFSSAGDHSKLLRPVKPNPTAPMPHEVTPDPEMLKETVSHDLWDALLREHVSAAGQVDYPAFKRDQARLQRYLDQLAATPPHSGWTRNEQMAYWINAYNAFTIKLILDNYPVSSIMDLHNGNAWDVKWIKLGDRTYTLNNIENDILRPKFKDARIHFAVNCAARSCPPLLSRAFTPAELDQQLDRQAKNFINNQSYNQISPDRARVSRIFEWYAQDFGNLVAYLNRFATTRVKSGAKVEYLDYNWELNGK